MGRKIRTVLNGDLTDLLTLNILIYTNTYVLSVIFSILIYKVSPPPEEDRVSKLLQILTDCIVPTTSTLVLGNVIQNIALAGRAGVSRVTLSIWALIAVFAYMLIYPFFRDVGWWLSLIVWAISLLIVILGMHAIIQVDKECHANTKNLSG